MAFLILAQDNNTPSSGAHHQDVCPLGVSRSSRGRPGVAGKGTPGDQDKYGHSWTCRVRGCRRVCKVETPVRSVHTKRVKRNEIL